MKKILWFVIPLCITLFVSMFSYNEFRKFLIALFVISALISLFVAFIQLFRKKWRKKIYGTIGFFVFSLISAIFFISGIVTIDKDPHKVARKYAEKIFKNTGSGFKIISEAKDSLYIFKARGVLLADMENSKNECMQDSVSMILYVEVDGEHNEVVRLYDSKNYKPQILNDEEISFLKKGGCFNGYGVTDNQVNNSKYEEYFEFLRNLVASEIYNNSSITFGQLYNDGNNTTVELSISNGILSLSNPKILFSLDNNKDYQMQWSGVIDYTNSTNTFYLKETNNPKNVYVRFLANEVFDDEWLVDYLKYAYTWTGKEYGLYVTYDKVPHTIALLEVIISGTKKNKNLSEEYKKESLKELQESVAEQKRFKENLEFIQRFGIKVRPKNNRNMEQDEPSHKE